MLSLDGRPFDGPARRTGHAKVSDGRLRVSHRSLNDSRLLPSGDFPRVWMMLADAAGVLSNSLRACASLSPAQDWRRGRVSSRTDARIRRLEKRGWVSAPPPLGPRITRGRSCVQPSCCMQQLDAHLITVSLTMCSSRCAPVHTAWPRRARCARRRSSRLCTPRRARDAEPLTHAAPSGPPSAWLNLAS